MNIKTKQDGQVLIIAVIFFTIILVLVASLMQYVSQNSRASRIAVANEQAIQIADAGIDRALHQLNATAGSYTGETGTVLGSGEFDVSVTNVSGNVKDITVTAYIPNKAAPQLTKQVKAQASIGTATVSFNYGVQVGAGGLQMSNTASIEGNVYSNGPITGSNSPYVTGDAYSAGGAGLIDGVDVNGAAYAHSVRNNIVGGSAFGHTLSGATVNGSAFMNTISSCTIAGDAFYASRTGCTVGGSVTTPYAGEADPAIQPFPIPDAQITDWKNQAEAGGVISGGLSLSGTTQMTLGPKKIVGNLSLSNSAKITLTGPLWVTGTVSLSNSATIALDSSYGNLSEVIVSDGSVSTSNSVQFQKAGPDSYIMMVALPTGGAFSINNSANTLIAYAPNGEVNISNNVTIREVTAYRLNINNTARVIYETGLANLQLDSGPGGSWEILRGTWREIN